MLFSVSSFTFGPVKLCLNAVQCHVKTICTIIILLTSTVSNNFGSVNQIVVLKFHFVTLP